MTPTRREEAGKRGKRSGFPPLPIVEDGGLAVKPSGSLLTRTWYPAVPPPCWCPLGTVTHGGASGSFRTPPRRIDT